MSETKKRPSLGFGGEDSGQGGFGAELDRLDLSEWHPAARKSPPKPDPATARAAAASAGFRSREPAASPPQAAAVEPARQVRRRRTGRNRQFNIKATPETVDTFYAIADAQGWGIGETLEHAVALLAEAYPPPGQSGGGKGQK